MPDVSLPESTEASWETFNALFSALGRIFICLDERFRVVHATSNIDDLLGPGSARLIETLPIEALLGNELFGATGALRVALNAGHRKERCHGHLRLAGGAIHSVSVSAAPAPPELLTVCGRTVKSIVVLEPREADIEWLESAPAPSLPARPIPATSHDDAARLQEALAAHRWRRRETARALRISRSTLWRKMRDAGLV